MLLFLTTSRVQFGSLQHVLPISLAIIICVLIIKLSKSKSRDFQKNVFKFLGLFVSGFMLMFHLYQSNFGTYDVKTDLPLFLCSFMALFIFIFTTTQKFWLFEVLLFWIILGTSQGIITPDIENGFPSFDYFRYWIVHLGLIIIITYAIVILKMKPKLKSVFKSFIVLQLYISTIMLINYVLGSNYSYLNYKPVSGSVLDYLGEWPNYIITVQLFLIPAFLLIYLPFRLAKRRPDNT